MPTIGMMGEFVKGGTSWLQLDTVEEWQPVPVLILPRLHGLLVLYANGTMKIDVEAWMDQWVIVPNFVEWVDVYVSVDVAPFNASGVEGVPDMVVFMRGGLLVGGDDGFFATIEGTIDTAERSAVVSVQHPGGWSPLPALSDYFSTPRFDGTAWFNVNSTYVALDAKAEFVRPIGIAGILEFTAHPYIEGRAGAAFSIRFLKQTNESEPQWQVAFDAGLRVGGENGATLGCTGEIVKGGTSWLVLESREEWQLLPVLMVPKMNGSLIFYPNGTTLVEVEAAMDRWVIVPNMLEGRNVYINIDVAPFNVSNVTEKPDMAVYARGGLLLGGDDGFYAELDGSFDTSTRSARIHVVHAGGWPPVSALEEWFTTPKFDGEAFFNWDGWCYTLHADAQWLAPIGIPGLVELVAHPLVSSSTGLQLTVDMKTEICCTEDEEPLDDEHSRRALQGSSSTLDDGHSRRALVQVRSRRELLASQEELCWDGNDRSYTGCPRSHGDCNDCWSRCYWNYIQHECLAVTPRCSNYVTVVGVTGPHDYLNGVYERWHNHDRSGKPYYLMDDPRGTGQKAYLFADSWGWYLSHHTPQTKLYRIGSKDAFPPHNLWKKAGQHSGGAHTPPTILCDEAPAPDVESPCSPRVPAFCDISRSGYWCVWRPDLPVISSWKGRLIEKSTGAQFYRLNCPLEERNDQSRCASDHRVCSCAAAPGCEWHEGPFEGRTKPGFCVCATRDASGQLHPAPCPALPEAEVVADVTYRFEVSEPDLNPRPSRA